MSWTTGANVFVAIAEQDELAAGKVLHENKSGTVRVQLNDGTKVTVGPEEVFENPNKTPKNRPRSRSPARKGSGGRGRSPARPKSPARTASAGRKRSTSRGRPKTTPKTKEEKPEKVSTAKKSAEKKKEEPVTSPSMTLRVRRWNKDDAIDSDTDETKTKKKVKEEGPAKTQVEFGGAFGMSFILFSLVGSILIALLMLKSGSLNVRDQDWRKLLVQLPKADWRAPALLAGFWLLQALLALVPVGPVENALPGATGPRQVRRNGLLSLLVTVGLVLGLRRYGYAVAKTQFWDYLLQWFATSVVGAVLLALFCAWKASKVPISQQNPDVVATGRFYAFLMGKQINPVVGQLHLKMTVFRTVMIGALVLYLLTFLHFEPTGYTATAALVLPSLYVLDFLVFEHQFLTSFEVQSEGFGAVSAVGYLTFPFCAAITPLYVLTAKVHLLNWITGATCLLFTIGLLINRLSNNQKHRFRKNPMDPAVSHLETLPTARGKKLLVSGWWGLVRHPNYLGDILTNVALGLTAGFGHFLPWFTPVMSVLCLLHRVSRDHRRCQAKYGDAWTRYCDKVKHRVFPKIY